MVAGSMSSFPKEGCASFAPRGLLINDWRRRDTG